jgi:hypothetical protein
VRFPVAFMRASWSHFSFPLAPKSVSSLRIKSRAGGIVGTYDEETPVGGTGRVGGGRTSGCTHHESSGSRVANMAWKDQREPDSPSRASADLAPTALVGGTRPKEWHFRDGSWQRRTARD